MSGCEYEQEDFCIFEDIEGKTDWRCGFNKDGHCTAEPSDLVEVCELCGNEDCYNEECLESQTKEKVAEA